MEGGVFRRRPVPLMSQLPPVTVTLEDLEKELNRGQPPSPNCTSNELTKYMTKFKILLPKAESEEDESDVDGTSSSPLSPNTSVTFPADEDMRHDTIQGKKSDIDAAVLFQPRKVPKSPQVIQELMKIVPKWATIAHLDDREIMTLVEAMQLREFPAGTVIYSAGESLDNPEVYFILRGHVVIQQKTGGERVIPQGSHFGEQEVTSNSARIATAMAAVTMTQLTTCYALDEEHLRNILTAGAHNKRERYVKWLEKIEWLKNLDRQKKVQLADALETKKYNKGEKLISYGLPGEWMYIIEEGRVDIWGFSDQHVPITEKPVCSFGIGDCVGELEFIAEDPAFHITQADVVAGTDVRTVRLHQRHFELCLGPIKDVLKDQVATLEKFEYIRARMKRMKI